MSLFWPRPGVFLVLERKNVISVAEKAQTISQYQVTGPTDTGSPEVQVALATQRILQLTEHMKINKFDYHSRRGLLNLVSLRNKLLKYLNKNHLERYRALIKKLNLRDKY